MSHDCSRLRYKNARDHHRRRELDIVLAMNLRYTCGAKLELNRNIVPGEKGSFPGTVLGEWRRLVAYLVNTAVAY